LLTRSRPEAISAKEMGYPTYPFYYEKNTSAVINTKHVTYYHSFKKINKN
jgi:hypothetical protein